MKIKELLETATAGATSAANVAVGVAYPNVKGQQPKKKGKGKIAPNALDIKGANLITGGSLVKR
jgi:hypothetical protein